MKKLPLFSPICGIRPAPGRAQDVIAPPYDVLDSREARELAQGKPLSFLHVSKAEIDLRRGRTSIPKRCTRRPPRTSRRC